MEPCMAKDGWKPWGPSRRCDFLRLYPMPILPSSSGSSGDEAAPVSTPRPKKRKQGSSPSRRSLTQCDVCREPCSGTVNSYKKLSIFCQCFNGLRSRRLQLAKDKNDIKRDAVLFVEDPEMEG